MDISSLRKNITNFVLNYFLILITSWIAMSSFKLIRYLGEDPIGNILFSEGVQLEVILYLLFSLFLIFVLYLYSRLEKRLLINKKILFATVLFSQCLLQAGIEGIIEFKFLNVFGNQYIGLFVFYLITVGVVVLLLRLFKGIEK